MGNTTELPALGNPTTRGSTKKTRDPVKASGFLKRFNIDFRPAKAKATPVVPSAPVVAPPATATTPVSMQPPWSGGVAVKKGLKGGAGKKTCLITVGGQDYVLKGAPKGTIPSGVTRVPRDDRSTTVDNAAASELIRALALDGVRAPQIRAVDNTETADVVAALTTVANGGGSTATDARELIASFGQGEVQLSEVDARGIDPDKIFIDPARAEDQVKACALRKAIIADPASGWDQAMREVSKDIYEQDLADRCRAAKTRIEKETVLAELKTKVKAPGTLTNVQVLEEVLDDRVEDGLAAGQQEIADRELQQDQLRDFVKSPKGIAAYAGVAAADLVTGMDDRMLGAWNGGNFLFDAQAGELACVDNNKRPTRGLTEASPDDWNSWFDKIVRNDKTDEDGNRTGNPASLVDAVFDTIYGRGDGGNPDRPGDMPGVDMNEREQVEAKKIVRDTLFKVVERIETTQSPNSAAAKRGKRLKEVLDFQDIIDVPADMIWTGTLPDLQALDKMKRGIASLPPGSWGRQATEIKETLRKNPSAAGAAMARADLDRAIKKHPKDSAGGRDRLAVHIELIAKACSFADWLDTAADRMADKLDKTKAGRDTPPRSFYPAMRKRCAAAAERWLGDIASEPNIAAKIAAALAKLPASAAS